MYDNDYNACGGSAITKMIRCLVLRPRGDKLRIASIFVIQHELKLTKDRIWFLYTVFSD